MKRGLLYVTIFFCLINNAYGEESNTRISFLRETMENGSASTLGISSGGIFYAGFSLSYITSSTVIQHNNRTTIYPIYIFAGLRAPWKLSPYIELGGDLPEAIIDDLFQNEENAANEIDYYYSGGLEYSVTDKLSFSLHAKKYNFIFRENFLAPLSKSRQNSYGMGVTIHF